MRGQCGGEGLATGRGRWGTAAVGHEPALPPGRLRHTQMVLSSVPACSCTGSAAINYAHVLPVGGGRARDPVRLFLYL